MTFSSRLAATLCSGLLVAGFVTGAPEEPKPPTDAATEDENKLGPVSPQVTKALLNLVNQGKEAALYRTPGLIRPYVEKIMAHRAAGKTFTSLEELQKVAAIPTLDLGLAVASFEEAMPTPPQTVVTRGKGKSAGAGAPAQGVDGTPAPLDGEEPIADANAGASGQGPIGSVRPGFYGKLPGYEQLDSIDPVKKHEFLETINREMCSCGCKTETLAFCLVNDPGCPIVKARVKKIYDDIVSKPPR